jgi:hypothetical protein
MFLPAQEDLRSEFRLEPYIKEEVPNSGWFVLDYGTVTMHAVYTILHLHMFPSFRWWTQLHLPSSRSLRRIDAGARHDPSHEGLLQAGEALAAWRGEIESRIVSILWSVCIRTQWF